MRLAVIPLDNPDPDGASGRDFLGRSIALHQMDIALSLGCERILCLARGGAQLAELEQHARETESSFVQVRTVAALRSEISASDEVLVFANALLPDCNAMKAFDQAGILAFPAGDATPLGYERIDATRAWAGVMLTPGAIAAGLADLPDDIDPVATWLRLALQSGVGIVPLDPQLLHDSKWSFRPDADTLAFREKRWIADHARPVDFRAPGLAIAEKAGLRLATDLAGSPYRNAATLTALALLLGALVFAGLALPVFAFLLVGLAFILERMGRVVHRVDWQGVRKHNWLSLDHLTDLTLALILVFTTPQELGWLRGFVPLVLGGLLYLVRTDGPPGLRVTCEDRSVLAVLLASASVFGAAFEAAAALALLLLACAVVERREENVAQ